MAIPQERALVTVIGDVVGSRRVSDRRKLHAVLQTELEQASLRARLLVQPFALTVGDEFQAVFDSIAEALAAVVRLRLSLLPQIDTRFGVGFGTIVALDTRVIPAIQDGPGWWAAREAIDYVKDSESRYGGSRQLRTWFATAQGTWSPSVEAVAFIRSFLICQDEIIGKARDRALRVALYWLDGHTQTEIAQFENVTQSAISQVLRTSGARALRDSYDLLRQSLR